MTLEFLPYHLNLKHKWTISSGAVHGGGTNVAAVVLVRLKDKSITGLGEAPTSRRYAQSVASIQEFLRLVDANKLSFDDIPGSMAYLEKLAPGNYSAKCALNVALVDGAARQAAQPVYDFLGLGFAENKHLTSYSIGIDTPEMIRRKVTEAAPYPILKLKVGSSGDRENLAALRQINSTKTVRVDANEAWTTKEEALRQLEWLVQDGNVELVEQPMPASTPLEDLIWLKNRSPLPLFGDESCQNARDVSHCVQCYDGVVVKLIKTGGITGAHETLQAARQAGLLTMIGCMIETSILITAAAHLADLTTHLDIDGNLLISDDPYIGATAEKGALSFAATTEKTGLRVKARNTDPFGG
jgi:L-alanine-DL-glutamate epimerase-like enolase superfamily enzyme